jgi:catechol 2,3-dioxygenase-like lactoylglutathione lyase family enzyme
MALFSNGKMFQNDLAGINVAEAKSNEVCEPSTFRRQHTTIKNFYTNILGLRVVQDHADFVQFENGFALHEGVSLHRTVFGCEPNDPLPYGRNNLVLYFEVPDIDAAFQRIVAQVDLIHPVLRQAWGQRVFRFYVTDQHIVEIGEPQR